MQAVLDDPNIDKTKTIKSLTRMFDVKQDAVIGCYGNKNTDVLAYMDAGKSFLADNSANPYYLLHLGL